MVARNYTALTLNLANNSTLTQYDVTGRHSIPWNRQPGIYWTLLYCVPAWPYMEPRQGCSLLRDRDRNCLKEGSWIVYQVMGDMSVMDVEDCKGSPLEEWVVEG